MNPELLNIIKSIDSQIISLFIQRDMILFILCLHNLGYFYVMNVQDYRIQVSDLSLNQYSVYYIKMIDSQIDPLPDEVLYMYQQYSNDFPQYNQKVIYILNDFIILNAMRAYKILDNNDKLLKSFYRIYDVSFLYDNKIAFQEDLMVFKDDLNLKIESMTKEDSNYDFFQKITDIENLFSEFFKFKKLYYSILHYQRTLKIELKELEDNSSVYTVNDSRKRNSIKQKKKNKMRSLEHLSRDVSKTLSSTYHKFLQKFLTYLYFRTKIKRNIISLQSSENDFEKQFNSTVLG